MLNNGPSELGITLYQYCRLVRKVFLIVWMGASASVIALTGHEVNKLSKILNLYQVNYTCPNHLTDETLMRYG